MRVPSVLLLTGALLTAALPRTAFAQAQVSSDAPALAARLIDLTVPFDVLQQATKTSFLTSFRGSFERNAQIRSYLEGAPGLLDAIMAAASLKVDEVLASMWPQMRESWSATYADGLTVRELEAAAAFYSGPTGRKLVDATAFLGTGGDIRQVLTPAELARFAEFGRSVAGQKIARLHLEMTRDTIEIFSKALAAQQSDFLEAAMAPLKAHLATMNRR